MAMRLVLKRGVNMKINFLGFLAAVFITLKLTGYITWSWWLVLAPLWIPFAVVYVAVFILAIILFLGFIMILLADAFGRHR